jgi:hypothetical protein
VPLARPCGSNKPGENTVTEAAQAAWFLHRALLRHARGGHHQENRQRFRDAISKAPKNLFRALRKLPLKKSLERNRGVKFEFDESETEQCKYRPHQHHSLLQRY